MRAAWCSMKDGCMSTTNPIETMIEPWDDIDPTGALDRAPRGAGSIVPSSSIAGRSLADVRASSKEEAKTRAAPCLRAGLHLEDLPIPRLIVIKLPSGVTPNFAGL